MPLPNQSEPSSPRRASADPGGDAVADPVGAPLRALLALYADELRDVRFPGIDVDVLGAAADDVQVAFDDVTRLEAALAEAQAQLAGTQEKLLAKAGRAVAYGRVFAIGNDELMARIDSIALPRVDAGRGRLQLAAVVDVPKRRGRKSQPPTETLFAGPSPSDTSEGSEASDESGLPRPADVDNAPAARRQKAVAGGKAGTARMSIVASDDAVDDDADADARAEDGDSDVDAAE